MILRELFEKARAARGRLARLALLGGLAFSFVRLMPSVPREQTLLFRFDGHGLGDRAVKRLSATWRAEGKSEPAGGVSLNFSAAPSRSVQHSLSLPNGPYVLDISVEREVDEMAADSTANAPPTRDPVAGQAQSRVGSGLRSEPPQTSYVRHVHLEGGETVIRL